MARKSRKVPAADTAVQSAVSEMKVYRTAAYARLSVEDSRNPEGGAIENQLSLIRDYIESRPYLTQTAEYIDNGVTGTRFDRPEFIRMVNDARAGKIDCIVVKDLSRLGRNWLETGEYLEKIFPFFGIRFIAVTDGYDSMESSAAEDGLIVPLKNLINEAYAKDMSRKISTALGIKQRQGKFIGSKAPYGYMKDPEDRNRLIVDKEVSGVVKRIFECKAAGMGNGAIAKMLNGEGIASPMRHMYEKGLIKNEKHSHGLWRGSAVAAIILNPAYIGDMEQGTQKEAMYMGIKKYKPEKPERIYVAGTHEPIISRELFGRVQELAGERRRKYLEGKERYRNIQRKENKFRGILLCGDCGCRMKSRSLADGRSGSVRVYHDYFCPNSESYGVGSCKSKKIKMQDLEEAVEAALRVHTSLFLDTKETLQKLNRSAQARQVQDSYKKQMADVKRRMERAQSMNSTLYNDYADGILSERDYLYAKKKYVAEAEALSQRLKELSGMQANYEDGYSGDGKMAEVMGQYADFQELTPELAHALVRRIVFYGGDRVEVEFTFADEMEAFLKLTEQRKGEASWTQEAT